MRPKGIVGGRAEMLLHENHAGENIRSIGKAGIPYIDLSRHLGIGTQSKEILGKATWDVANRPCLCAQHHVGAHEGQEVKPAEDCNELGATHPLADTYAYSG